LIVSGYDDLVDQFGLTYPLIDMLDHRFTKNIDKGLPFEPSGAIPRRDDRSDFHRILNR